MDETSAYLRSLTRRIEDRTARKEIRQELLAHIEDQKEVYINSGMSEEEAEREAVRQMGDPEEVGIELNRIHRLKIDWKTAVGIAGFSLLGYYGIILLRLMWFTEEVRYDADVIPGGIKFWMLGAFCLVFAIFWSAVEKYDDLPFFYGYAQSGGSNINSAGVCAIGISLMVSETFWQHLILVLIMEIVMLSERYYIDTLRNRKEQRYLFCEGMAKTNIDYKGKAKIGDEFVKVRIRKHAIQAGTPVIVVGIQGFMLVVEPLI